jgi:hypothetical protein
MYTERYLTFADILGFADIVKKSARDSSPQRHDALVKALVEAGTYHPGLNASDDIQFQTFSDSIVMSSASTATGLVHILVSMADLSTITSIGCCPRAATGHATTEPSSVTNSRRLIGSPSACGAP